jgi:hypothetical protein
MRLKHLRKHLKTLEKTLQNIYNILKKNTCKYMCETYATSKLKHLQHTLKKQIKHLKQTLAYMYSHCNICNIPIYFYNIYTKHLQHISEM